MAFTTFDNAPYLYRKSGGGGDKEIDKLVGGTIAWNQQMIISTASNREMLGLTITNNHDGSLTIVGTATSGAFNYWLWGGYGLATELFTVVENHKYFTKGVILFGNTSVLLDGDKKISDTFGNISKATRSASVTGVRMANQTPNVTYNLKVYPMVCDLTLMFGSTIADYVYSLEQSSQGSGLAWLRSYGFFTEDYYDYNSGELKSVSNLVSHDMTGFNQWDGETETGYIDLNTGNEAASSTNQRSKYVRVFPSTTYCYTNETVQTGIRIAYYDANKVFVGTFANGTNTPQVFTTPSKAFYMRFYWADISRVCINFSSSRNGEYEPYTLHSYPLGDVTLRGLPKLNGNALYYDGDTYESNGTVTRKYGIVDMGTLFWAENNITLDGVSAKLYRSEALPNSALTYNSVALLCAKYATVKSAQRTERSASCGTSNGSMDIIDSTYNNAAEFKTAMSGVYLVYELASSTTETADTYTNPQWVDPNGTEKYTLSSNAFPMPVGHETTYNTDMGSKTVNTQVNLSMTEPQVRQVYAKEGDTARVLNIHLDHTEEDGTLRILRPDGTEVTADAVLVPDFYDGLMAEIPSNATEIVGKCYCDVEQNGVSSMPFTLNVKKNERQ